MRQRHHPGFGEAGLEGQHPHPLGVKQARSSILSVEIHPLTITPAFPLNETETEPFALSHS
jgi:hypothetical protein